jgi:regulator of sirC expression with transglutaminase-like and TPR domain
MSNSPDEILSPHRSAFAEMAARPDAAIDLAEACLLLAQEEYPGLDLRAYLGKLDAMGAEARRASDGETDPRRVIAALNRCLFETHGFHANATDYYDPRNSYLNEVLDRRTGIPITLSVVYMEVAGRIDFPVRGVGMPGHFLVKHVTPAEEILIDPFGGGAILAASDCQRILDGLSGGKLVLAPHMLAAVGPRQILTRMLSNLKSIYFNGQEYGKALAAVERLLALNPRCATEVRDRGLLASQLRRYAAATADLDRYLRMAPDAEDRDVIREHLRSLRQRIVALN